MSPAGRVLGKANQMDVFSRYRPGPRALCALAILWVLAPAAVRASDGALAPRAVAGVLDLSGYDFTRDGPARLDGEWAFYWDRLLGPGDFEGNERPPAGVLNLPGTWKGYSLDGRTLGGKGKATFRLRLIPPPGERTFTLRLFDAPMACRLWADGTLVAQSGVPGENASGEIPRRSLVLTKLKTDGEPVDLTLQISNYQFRKGGLTESILVAPPGPIEAAQMRFWGCSLFFAGCLLIMSGYHLVLYFWRNNEPSYLYFGGFCLLLSGYLCASNSTDWDILLFTNRLDPEFLERFSLACYVFSGAFIFRFFRSLFPREFHFALQCVSDARSVIFTIIACLFPMNQVYGAILIALVMSALFPLYYLSMLTVAVIRGRDGALFLLTGSILFSVASYRDIFVHAGLMDGPYVIQAGLFMFIVSQALALGRRFSNSFSAVERLSGELAANNAALRDEMAERARLEREVVDISEAERRRMSHELHDGLCQKLASARLWCSSLSRGSSPGGEKDASGAASEPLANLAALLRASADDAYNLSRGLWPVECDPHAPGPSLEDLVRSASRAGGPRIVYSRTQACKTCVNPHGPALYRIAQEALANALKHAHASRIDLSLRCEAPGGTILTVRDDGGGLDGTKSSQGGLGLSIMAYRARIIGATFRIENAPDGGTVVTCEADCGAVNKRTAAAGEAEHETA